MKNNLVEWKEEKILECFDRTKTWWPSLVTTTAWFLHAVIVCIWIWNARRHICELLHMSKTRMFGSVVLRLASPTVHWQKKKKKIRWENFEHSRIISSSSQLYTVEKPSNKIHTASFSNELRILRFGCHIWNSRELFFPQFSLQLSSLLWGVNSISVYSLIQVAPENRNIWCMNVKSRESRKYIVAVQKFLSKVTLHNLYSISRFVVDKTSHLLLQANALWKQTAKNSSTFHVKIWHWLIGELFCTEWVTFWRDWKITPIDQYEKKPCKEVVSTHSWIRQEKGCIFTLHFCYLRAFSKFTTADTASMWIQEIFVLSRRTADLVAHTHLHCAAISWRFYLSESSSLVSNSTSLCWTSVNFYL